MNKAILIATIVFVSTALFGNTTFAQAKPSNDNSPKEFQRQIFVPFESLDVLLQGNSNRVLLTRDEYDDLLKSAKTREIKRAPLDSAIVSAKYSGEVSEGVAIIKGELIVESLNEGLVQIPLPFSGVAIRSAMVGGDQPAKLWRSPQGQIALLTSKQARQTLTIEMTVPMQTSAARQSMSVQLPSPSATSFELTVPGNVEVKSGVPVVKRTYDPDSNSTKFDLLATRAPMNIVMSLNNRLLRDDQVAVSRVSHVSTELLSQWEIKDAPQDANESGKRLIVKLRQPTREDFVLNITAARNSGAIGKWQADDIRPIDVAGHVSVVGVLADIALKSAKLVSEGVIPIDHEFLLAAIPESVKSTSRGPIRD